MDILSRILIACALFSTLTLAQSVGAYTIFNTPSYAEQQTCVQNCLMNYGDNDSKLPGFLGCAWDGSYFYDACVCRADLAPDASSFLSSCGSSSCSLYPSDVTSLVSIYNSYCGRVASTPAGNEATTTLYGGSAPTVLVVTDVLATPTTLYSTQTLNGESSTQTGTASGSSGGGLSRSDQIALGCGLSIPLLAVIIAIWQCLRRRSLLNV